MGDTPKQMSFKDIKVIDLTTEMELKPGTNETLRAKPDKIIQK